ncbi:hypothetical protein Acr_29g0011180 [Actinidia rufa]|uniref:Uncharacterized protein n=1 Tax=Actinidia rufa TaxID=165716 RepID=A0A7J0HFP3_9ERIC|nr:hypothetical protein Acr_29g0011180 [Actinidia rufa]
MEGEGGARGGGGGALLYMPVPQPLHSSFSLPQSPSPCNHYYPIFRPPPLHLSLPPQSLLPRISPPDHPLHPLFSATIFREGMSSKHTKKGHQNLVSSLAMHLVLSLNCSKGPSELHNLDGRDKGGEGNEWWWWKAGKGREWPIVVAVARVVKG